MSTLLEHETPTRDIENDGSRFWYCTLDEDMPGYGVFGPATVGIVDEVAYGIIAYAHESNALPIIAAIRKNLGEI